MKKSVNTVLSLVFGIVICCLMVTAGVLASQTFNASFTVGLSYSAGVKCKITLAINSGTEYIIFNNSGVGEQPSTANVSSTSIDEDNADKMIINLGTTFTSMPLQSADTFNFKIYNYSNSELTNISCEPTSTIPTDIINVTSTATVSNKKVSIGNIEASTNGSKSGIIPVNVEVNKTVPIMFNIIINEEE